MPNATAIYARSVHAADLDRQVTDCRLLAGTKGWRIEDVYIDDDSVGRASRPELTRMLTDLRTGRIDGVVIDALDRLPLTAGGLEEFLAICSRSGVRDLATVTGDVDLSTMAGLTAAHVLAGDAARERLVRAKNRTARSGERRDVAN